MPTAGVTVLAPLQMQTQDQRLLVAVPLHLASRHRADYHTIAVIMPGRLPRLPTVEAFRRNAETFSRLYPL